MTKRIILFVVLPVIAFAIAAYFWPASLRPVTITFAAPAGTKVTGTYEADGVKSNINVEAPAEIAVTAREVTFEVRKDDQPGEMIAKIAVKDEGYATAGTEAGGWVRGGFKAKGGLMRGSVTFWATNSQAQP